MASAGGQANIRFIDYNSESSTTSVITANLTAANYAAQLAKFQTLVAAIEGISEGALNQSQLIAFTARGTATPPIAPTAQREKKWLVTYEDNQQYLDPPTNAVVNNGYGKVFNVEIPCAALILLQPNSDLADLSLPLVATFVTAFEEFALSPYGGTVNVLQIRYVGRAL